MRRLSETEDASPERPEDVDPDSLIKRTFDDTLPSPRGSV